MTAVPSIVAGTLQSDPRSGGVKKSSGVNVLPSVSEAWSQVRNDSNPEVDWIIVGYDGNSKSDITVLMKGNGGQAGCSNALPEGIVSFGGLRLESGRFVSFFHADESSPVMQRGRASMHRNGVFNVLEGCDGEIEISRNPHGASPNRPVPGGGGRGAISNKSLSVEEPKPLSNPEPCPVSDYGPELTVNSTFRPELKPVKSPERMTTSRPEPPNFSRPFQKVGSPYSSPYSRKASPESKMKSISSGSKEQIIMSSEEPTQGDVTEQQTPSVPYSELKGIDTSLLPPGVDPLNREMSLSDKEFAEVFEMDKIAFSKLAAWKKKMLKKDKGLF